MINFSDKEQVSQLLMRLQADAQPVFGIMTPQHMVEHLAFTVRFSNGKAPQQHHYPAEKEAKIKAYICYTDNPLTIGFRAPVLPVGELIPLRYDNLPDAIGNLLQEISDFENYFRENSSERPVNPAMGELDQSEWRTFHNKHFTHHFRQFNLINKKL